MLFTRKTRLLVAATLVFVSYQIIDQASRQTVVRQATTAEKVEAATILAPPTTKTLLDAVPDGSTTSYAEFRKTVGSQLADLLNFANPKSITRSGNHIVLDCAGPGPATMTAPQGEVSLQKRVEFDIDPTSTDVSVKNMKGVTIKLAVIAMELTEAKLLVDANGDTKISGKLSASSWLPSVPFTLTFGPDGQLK